MADRRYGALAAFIAAPLLIALTASRSESLRPQPPELRADASLEVISGRDTGGGTLREAITAAARHPGRVRIVIRPARITLLSPLPPLVNADGVVLDASESRCELDASNIGDIPALQITSPNTTISGLRIRNARDAAILVRAARATIRDVGVRDSEDGVVLSGAADGVVERSTFERNGNGVRIEGNSPRAVIRGCTFRNHDGAAIWAVSSARSDAPVVRVENNAFRDDRISIVVVNLGATIARNDIRGAVENGIYLMQSRSAVRSNRILGGAAGGILADRADNVRIEQNEIDHNASVGILVRSSRNAGVQRNVVYANAYGIASIFGDRGAPNVIAENLVMNHRVDGVFIVGSSPLLRANRLLQNSGAAARVLDFVPWDAPRIASDPRFDANTLTGNTVNAAVRGEYRPKRERETP
ncbi:MAG TPA: right-handed parallel beta-helix repeat-containing protein [Thermoanaerobaculia bacterium]|nr:right-handed parallel beta-helix repeat-containing protein [Thermoanaerobaculia bacterium]